MTKKIYFFVLRNEALISGEYINTKYIIENFQKEYEVVEVSKANHKKKNYISLDKIFNFFKILNKENKNKNKNKNLLIIKVPTSSQIPFLEIFLKNNKFETFYLVDGINYEIGNWKLFFEMLLHEPFLLIQRLIINNKFWNLFIKFFDLKIIVSSNFQKNILLQYINQKSKINIIQNYNRKKILEIDNAKNIEKIKFGYLGHNYPVKGFDLLINALKILDQQMIDYSLICKQPLRGKNFKIDHQKNIKINTDSLEEFMGKVDTLIFPFRAVYGTNVFPSAVVESIQLNKNIILPDFKIFYELISLCNYTKKTMFYKKNDYQDLAKCIKNSLYKKNENVFIENKIFNHQEIFLKWKKTINLN